MKYFFLISFLLCPFLIAGFQHQGPSYDSKARYALDAFSEKIATQYGFCFITSSVGAIADAKDAPWGIGFTSKEKVTLEELRPILKDILLAYLRYLNREPLIHDYFSHEKEEKLSPSSLGLKIAFWDENVDRPLFPYLAQVRFADGQVYYHYANPKTQALEAPTIETLESLGITANQYK